MKKELQALIEAAKAYKEYQSIGNGATLNCAIEDAEKVLNEETPAATPPQQYYYSKSICCHADMYMALASYTPSTLPDQPKAIIQICMKCGKQTLPWLMVVS